MKTNKRIVSLYVGYGLLAVFGVVLAITLYREFDPILLVLGLFFMGSGVSAFEGNYQFGVAIDRYRDKAEEFVSVLDKEIAKEEKKKHKTTIKV